MQAHPDYHDGYFERVDGGGLLDGMSPEYQAGWHAANSSIAILTGAGMVEVSRGRFEATTTIPKEYPQ